MATRYQSLVYRHCTKLAGVAWLRLRYGTTSPKNKKLSCRREAARAPCHYPENATLVGYAFCRIYHLHDVILCVCVCLSADSYLGDRDTDWRESLHGGWQICHPDAV